MVAQLVEKGMADSNLSCDYKFVIISIIIMTTMTNIDMYSCEKMSPSHQQLFHLTIF